MSIFQKALIISIVAHIAILLYEPPKPDQNKQKKQQEQTQEERITIKFNAKKKEQKIVSEDESGIKECDDYYIGIGILVDFLGQVVSVASGGPADRYGIKVGDFILTQIDTDKLKEGDVLSVSVSRDGIIDTYNIITERICRDDEDS